MVGPSHWIPMTADIMGDGAHKGNGTTLRGAAAFSPHPCHEDFQLIKMSPLLAWLKNCGFHEVAK